MKFYSFVYKTLLFLFITSSFFVYSQSDRDFSYPEQKAEAELQDDSVNTMYLNVYKDKLKEIDELRREDSIAKAQLEAELNSYKTTDNLKKQDLQRQIDSIEQKENNRVAQKKIEIESLKGLLTGYPVFGPLNDTLFLIYNKIGSFSASERADRATQQIREVYKDDYLSLDSVILVDVDLFVDIVYKDKVIVDIYEIDALWNDKTVKQQAEEYQDLIKDSIMRAQKENSFGRVLMRIGLVILAIAGAGLIIWLINKFSGRFVRYLSGRKNNGLKDLSYKGFTFLTKSQELNVLLVLIRILRWVLIIVALYLMIPVILRIFPFTRGWADVLFGLIWAPVRRLLMALWGYLPNLFTILIIFFVFRYLIRGIRYIFTGIASGKLKSGKFYADWAMPTFHIIRVLLYAFAFVMIFPYLPGANSPIFAGVSVFLGVLVSLGSSSALANMVSGLVIIYMRPFKIGDIVRLGDVTGKIIDKTMLVTRLLTEKNEEITIPNSAVLSGNTINYSSCVKTEGLIIHTDVTMGYDYAWQEIHQALLDSADKIDDILKDPKPFVLQVSLDDTHVSYQLNAYIKNPEKQPEIYSQLHQNIQDIFNERGFELLSPSYNSIRDGNTPAFPKKYMPKDTVPNRFKVEIDNSAVLPKENISDIKSQTT